MVCFLLRQLLAVGVLFFLQISLQSVHGSELQCSREELSAAGLLVPPDTQGQYHRVEEILENLAPNTRGLVLGDSLAESFPIQEAEAAMREHPVTNVGIAGFRSQQVIWLLKEPALMELSPHSVIMMVGTNNLGRDRACALAYGVERVAMHVHDIWPTASIMLIQVPPRAPGVVARDERRLEAASILSEFARSRPWLRVRSLDAAITNDPTSYLPDRVHLTSQAYAAFAREIQDSR